MRVFTSRALDCFRVSRLPRSPSSKSIVGLSGRRAMHLAFLGHAYADTGRRAEALRIIEELNVRRREMYVSPLSFAIIYIGLGQSTTHSTGSSWRVKRQIPG